jgi:hypothetical protein
MGDYGEGPDSVEEFLQLFEVAGCHIVICACTLNKKKHSEMIRESIERYSRREFDNDPTISSTLHLINKPRIKDPALYRIEDYKKAVEILACVKQSSGQPQDADPLNRSATGL